MLHQRSRTPELGQTHHRPRTPGLRLGDHALALVGTVVELIHDHVTFVDNLVKTGIHLLVSSIFLIVHHHGHTQVISTVVRTRTARPAFGRFGRSGCYVMHAPVAHHQILHPNVNIGNQLLGRHIVCFGIGLIHLHYAVLLEIQSVLRTRGHHHRSGKQTSKCYNLFFHRSRCF